MDMLTSSKPYTPHHAFDIHQEIRDPPLLTRLSISTLDCSSMDSSSMRVSNPATGEKITSVAAGTKEAVDLAVKAAQQNMPGIQTFWGLKVPGSQRGTSSHKLADLLERNSEQIAALESLNFVTLFTSWTSETFSGHPFDYNVSGSTLRYYAGWADKIYGKTIETNELKLAYTKHEPFGVVGAIVPWNGPTMTLAWKLGPALTTGNTIVVKVLLSLALIFTLN
ncbi:aldehyde dehydrogenase family-domain-containing protein [Mucidula mucida]|nr:aldehyde dehydrogenase family-domain-containing protein [Mucidula mucida]